MREFALIASRSRRRLEIRGNGSQSIPRCLMAGYRKPQRFESREEEILDALKTVAGFIADDGEEYLPIFDRLESALNEEKNKQAALSRALSLANRN